MAEGAAAKRTKSGDDVEIDMREEAQKGRVSSSNQTTPFLSFARVALCTQTILRPRNLITGA